MNYSQCFQVISLYAPKAQPLFADGWERFPAGQAAETVITELNSALVFWDERNPETHQQIKDCIKSIQTNREY